jgi:methionine synthase II (cobalamin-independent)
MELQPRCLATAIGSMPHAEPEAALDLVFRTIPDAPVWPQLPKRDLREQMEPQYSEGLPRAVLDTEKGRLYFDTSGDYYDDLAEFYAGYMAVDEEGDYSAGVMSPDYAIGIPALESRLQARGSKLPIVKCQTTGPISFALTVVDENKRSIYYNDEFVDVVVKGLTMKCRWQIQKLRPYAETVICFVDEPILSAFGSSTYVSVQRDDVVAHLSEVVEAIHGEDAVAGVHCCGNTEWSILVDAGADILSFDACEHGETLALYPEHMKRHLIERGNSIAWGVVPTSAAVRNETVADVVARFEKLVAHFGEQTTIDAQTVRERAFITPSCGTGSLDVADAEKVFELLGETSENLRKKYGF